MMLGVTEQISAEELAFRRLYGDWQPFDVAGARAFFAGYDRPWWIVGGHAVEAFTGAVRRHEDIAVVIFRRDLEAFRDHVGARFHVWSVGSGMLRPLGLAPGPAARRGARRGDLRP